MPTAGLRIAAESIPRLCFQLISTASPNLSSFFHALLASALSRLPEMKSLKCFYYYIFCVHQLTLLKEVIADVRVLDKRYRQSFAPHEYSHSKF
jgi:hypothetical protein